MTHGSQWPQLQLTAQIIVLFKDTFSGQNKIKRLCQILFMQYPLLVILQFDLHPCADISAIKHAQIQYNTSLHYDIEGKKSFYFQFTYVMYMIVTGFAVNKCVWWPTNMEVFFHSSM